MSAVHSRGTDTLDRVGSEFLLQLSGVAEARPKCLRERVGEARPATRELDVRLLQQHRVCLAELLQNHAAMELRFHRNSRAHEAPLVTLAELRKLDWWERIKSGAAAESRPPPSISHSSQ